MKYERAYLEELADKWENGTITPEEAEYLLGWYNSYDDTRAEVSSESPATAREFTDQAVRSLLIRIAAEERAGQVPAGSSGRTGYLVWLPAAAAALLLVFGLLVYTNRNEQPPATARGPEADIGPGGNRATLTLANGRIIELDSAQEGIRVSGETIVYVNGPELAALVGDEDIILSTPTGGTYQVILPDSSRVWLNAATTLTYPRRFSGDTRVVTITGEAYFEVNQAPVPAAGGRKGTKPFIVRSSGQEVRVLGTAFNISAYPDDDRLTTTLVNGSVKITANSSPTPRSLVLQPGEQAVLDAAGRTFEKYQADPAPATAWKDGRFSFDDKSFHQIMAEMARWYNLKVVYDGPVPTERFMGGAFRNSNLSIVLALLESAHISYEVKENRTIRIRNTANTK